MRRAVGKKPAGLKSSRPYARCSGPARTALQAWRLSYFRRPVFTFTTCACHLRLEGALPMGPVDAGSKDPESLSLRLNGVLQEVHQEQWPHLPNPPGCKKRASVSLVIRIRPAFTQEALFDKDSCSPTTQPFQACLEKFFSQPWVQHGDPEVLLIKRAARAGDRWTSHIALPGGKMEPDDANDRATSIRETMEETGLELNTDHCLYIGNLPERVIKVMWAETP